MMEYTLVFRRSVTTARTSRASTRPWVAVRPALPVARSPRATRHAARRSGSTRPSVPAPLAEVFIVPIYSALGLDGIAYDHFLAQCGAIPAALRLLATTPVDGPDEAEIARREIQALVMAAEVQHIVDQISA